MSPPPPAVVDVVIPTYNARDLLIECLRRLDEPVIARRIVVDDASDDDTVEAVRSALPDVDVVALPETRGLSYALNAGAARGDAPYVLFLNNDILAEQDAVRRLTEALGSDPDSVSAGGRLVDAETGVTQDSYRPRDFPTLATFAVRLFGIERYLPRNRWSGGHLRRRLADDDVVRVDQQPAGSCLLVRRDAFERVGAWDERYPFWYEDVDLSRRLAREGAALFVGPASFRHLGRHSTRGWSKPEQHRRLYHGTLRYGEANLPRAQRMALAAMVILVCLPRIAVFALLDRRAAAVYAGIARAALALELGRPLPVPAPERS